MQQQQRPSGISDAVPAANQLSGKEARDEDGEPYRNQDDAPGEEGDGRVAK